jgi:hypothetical protein
MFFKSLYTRWDEMSLRQMTPKREQIIRDRWAMITRFGTLRFTLLTGLALAVVMMAYVEILCWAPVPHRLVWSGDLFYFAALGFAMALMYCVGMRGWLIKIENWRSAGRLNFPPAAQKNAP